MAWQPVLNPLMVLKIAQCQAGVTASVWKHLPTCPTPKVLDLGWCAEIVAWVFLLLFCCSSCIWHSCAHTRCHVLRFNEKKGFGFIEPIDDAAKVLDKDTTDLIDLTPGTSWHMVCIWYAHGKHGILMYSVYCFYLFLTRALDSILSDPGCF